MTSKGEVHFKRSDHPDSDDEHDHEELDRKDTSGWESSDNEHEEGFMKSIISNSESFSAEKIHKSSFTIDIANDEEFKRSMANLYLNSYVATNSEEVKHCSDSILSCAACCQKAEFFVDHESVRFVPCAVEIDVSKAFGVSRRTLYAFLSSTNDNDKKYVLRSYKEWDHALPLVRLPPNATSDQRTSDVEDRRLRLNHSYGALYYNSTDSDTQTKLDKFLSFTDYTTKLFTKSITGGVDAKRHRTSVAPFTKENHCLVKTGNAFYSHQYMGVNTDELVFVMNNSRAYEKLRIPLTSILECHNVETTRQEFNLPDMYCVVVSTFSKKYEILLKTREVRDSWCHLLSAQVTVNQHGGGLYAGIAFESPSKSKTTRNSASLRRGSNASNFGEGEIRPFIDFVSKTKGWKGLSDRPALNSRSFTRYNYKHLFPGLNMRPGLPREDGRICNGNSGRCSSCLEPTGPTGIGYMGNGHEHLVLENPANIVVQDLLDCLHLPCLFVCKLLDLVLKLTKLMNAGVEEYGRNSIVEEAVMSSQDIHLTPEVHQLWIDFLDGVSLLQTIDLTNVSMSREDTFCMFMNLYHVMMLHGYFVLGRPATFMQWSSFFHKCTYEAFGDVFSMVELEHCIIRKVMPSINVGPITKTLVIPSTNYSFYNQYKDYRLIWAINCGTYVFIPYIPIFSPEKLVKQLSQVARKSLQMQMRINVPTNTVTLPLPCQWFIGYFALKPESDPSVFSFEYDDTVSGNQILTTLLPDLGEDMKKSLTALLKKKVPITIKYSAFEFKCQLLYKMTDDVEEGK